MDMDKLQSQEPPERVVIEMSSQTEPVSVCEGGRGDRLSCVCVCVWGRGGLSVKMHFLAFKLQLYSVYKTAYICRNVYGNMYIIKVF